MRYLANEEKAGSIDAVTWSRVMYGIGANVACGDELKCGKRNGDASAGGMTFDGGKARPR